MSILRKSIRLLVIMFSFGSFLAWGAQASDAAPVTTLPALEEADDSLVGMDVGYETQEEADAAFLSAEEERSIREWEQYDATEKLRKYDKLALKIVDEFEKADAAPPPFAGEQGYVMFPYGAVVPRINCRVFRVTDIALEPGEEILGIHAGDTVRWQFSPSVSMQGDLQVSHIIVKPSMPGISTNLMVHTDRRAYNIDLIAIESGQYTPGVAFTYPNTDLNRAFGVDRNRRAKQTREGAESGGDAARLDNINAGYRIIPQNGARVDWKPLSVFDDNLKTYIRMPERISEAPAFYIRLDGKETLVNYRVKGRYYIIDRLFDKGYLKVGRKKIVIIRGEPLAMQNESSDEIKVIAKDDA